jgi:tRNA(Arg) A34 adenosine deaminase TadA
MNKKDREYMELALSLAQRNMEERKGGPFGAVIVKDGEIIASGSNTVLQETDPTCHAEIVAIRKACEVTGEYHLEGCTLYSSCEPCPMCLGAIYWSRIDRLVFAAGKEDAAIAEFADEEIYEEFKKSLADRKIPTEQVMQQEARRIFEEWKRLGLDIVY